MANDVKALPVVAWIWRWADGEEEVVFVDATTIKFNPEFEDVPTQIASLVRQSDAESAIAELRAEVAKAVADAAEIGRGYLEESHRADTAEARLAEVKRAIADLLLYFKSGNSIPVEKATIKADSPEIVTLAAFLGEGK